MNSNGGGRIYNILVKKRLRRSSWILSRFKPKFEQEIVVINENICFKSQILFPFLICQRYGLPSLELPPELLSWLSPHLILNKVILGCILDVPIIARHIIAKMSANLVLAVVFANRSVWSHGHIQWCFCYFVFNWNFPTR